jgi:hypothetical protein
LGPVFAPPPAGVYNITINSEFCDPPLFITLA